MTLDTPEGLSIIWVPAIKKFALYLGTTRVIQLSENELLEHGLQVVTRPKEKQQ